LPTPAAWRVGQALARALVEKHMMEEGRYPENVALFWMCGDLINDEAETMAQMMALLGVEPQWAPNGHLNGFSITPLSKLGRPRIDLTVRTSAIIRDIFPDVLDFLDQAIQAVALLEEPDHSNFIRKHTLAQINPEAIQDEEPKESWRRATFRIFSAQPGAYHSGVNLAILASAWKTEADLAEIFIHCNAYAYGKNVFGQASPMALETALSTVDVTYNKVSNDEQDLLGCCCYYGTHGGLSTAATHFKGEKVHNYYGDTREPKAVAVRSLADEVRRVVRAKLLNPAWIESMKRHGYKGAGDISKRAGRVYGWEATTQEVDDWIFDDIAQTFVLDEENRAFFKEHNPWALEELSRRLLEAEARELWQAQPEILAELKKRYLEMEGWLEEQTETYGGQIQGGSVDIITASEVKGWQDSLNRFRQKNN
jgi:cobaltochelatase CobN